VIVKGIAEIRRIENQCFPLKAGMALTTINTKKLSSLQRKLMTKNDTSKTANMKWDGSV
jgi:hypothetical protein